jgi:hypothetical protein
LINCYTLSSIYKPILIFSLSLGFTFINNADKIINKLSNMDILLLFIYNKQKFNYVDQLAFISPLKHFE